MRGLRSTLQEIELQPYGACEEKGAFEGTIAVSADGKPAGSIRVTGSTRIPVVDIAVPAGTVEVGNTDGRPGTVQFPITHDLGFEASLSSNIPYDMTDFSDKTCGVYMNPPVLDASGTGYAELGCVMSSSNYCSKSGDIEIVKPDCQRVSIPVKVVMD